MVALLADENFPLPVLHALRALFNETDIGSVQPGQQATVTVDHGQQQGLTLPAGTYDVTEAPKAGWTFGSATCNGGSPISIAAGARVTLANGASVTCGFVNNQ